MSLLLFVSVSAEDCRIFNGYMQGEGGAPPFGLKGVVFIAAPSAPLRSLGIFRRFSASGRILSPHHPELLMRHFASALLLLICSSSAAPQQHASPANAPPHSQKIPPTILAAKTVFFDDQTGVPAVGNDALAQLRRWHHFQIVNDKSQADLILVLSASPPKGDHILYSGGQTGTIDNSGRIHEDSVPQYLVSGPPRATYLTAFDAKSGQSLWSDSRQWGGLLTGHNSAGARLITKLKKEMKN